MDVIDVDIRSFSYKGEDLAALKNVRFSVERGELVVLTGNSGCGKTTHARHERLDSPISTKASSMGESSFSGKAWESSPPASSPARSATCSRIRPISSFTRKAAGRGGLVGENLGMPRES